MTLSGISATTQVHFDPDLSGDKLLLNGEENALALKRVSTCLDELRARAGISYGAQVVSNNDFPTSAGLASSAAGFAALVVAADSALGLGLSATELSRIARRASGSAARSLFGGYVLLPIEDADPAAVPMFDENYFPLQVVIAIVSESAKPVGSTDGMVHTQQTSDYYDAWVTHQAQDLALAQRALELKDFEALAEIAEASCLKMHGSMLAARPGLMYWTPATLACLHAVRSLRARGVPVFFTVDAGPQVKAFCLPEAASQVATELAAVPGVLNIIRASTGKGAQVLKEGT